MRPHEKLDVWKKAVDLVIAVYGCTKSFPDDEKYGLTSQIRRAAVSIPANLAEGAGRMHDKEFLRFISIAQGSSSELETELLIALRLGYVSGNTYDSIRRELDQVGRMMIGLSRNIHKRLD